MPFNGSSISESPFDTIISPFVDLLGAGFFVIPIAIIASALYVKTKSPITVSAFLLASGTLFTSAGLFASYPELVAVFMIVTLLGVVGMFLSIYFMRK
jgi:hypothetical protein